MNFLGCDQSTYKVSTSVVEDKEVMVSGDFFAC